MSERGDQRPRLAAEFAQSLLGAHVNPVVSFVGAAYGFTSSTDLSAAGISAALFPHATTTPVDGDRARSTT